MSVQETEHTMKSYNEELDHLYQLIRSLAKKVRLQLQHALDSLRNEDVEAARIVIVRDEDINELDIQADEEIVRVIARRQPVAGDLRSIMTTAKIVSDLERVGDQSRRIARLTVRFYANDANPPNKHMLADIYSMSKQVDLMLEKALDAFSERNLSKSGEVIRMGLELDDMFRSALRRLSTFLLEDARSVGHVVDVVLALRAVDRIGGHAKNIARYMVYLIKGKDVRHESVDQLLLEMDAE